jgi:pantetheine-phosphate adenylyltransferase
LSLRVALLPGSFDPVTLGHLDLVRRGVGLFDRVVVSIARAGRKTLFSPEERAALFTQALEGLPGATVEIFDGLVIEQARRHGATVLLRGIRNTQDWDYEMQMALANRGLAPEIETLFLPPAAGMAQVSSSLVREVITLGGDVSLWVPPAVVAAVRDRRAAGPAREP